MRSPQPLLVICGPTGSGKSSLALDLARRYPLEIISADSRQVYRGMDIGTAKPTVAEQAMVPHHMIDLIDPDEEFSVAAFIDRARPLIEEIHRRDRLPCVVGGTGLYIRALLGGMADLPTGDEDLRRSLHRQEEEQGSGTLHAELRRRDPVAAARIHPHNLIRTVRALEVCLLSGRPFSEIVAAHEFVDQPYTVLKLAPDHPRTELYRRIDRRTEQMLDAGLVDEVIGLLQRYSSGIKALQTLGYREVLRYLAGDLDAARMCSEIQKFTRQYAKKQLTWFRREPDMIWVDSTKKSGTVERYIENWLFNQRSGHGQVTI